MTEIWGSISIKFTCVSSSENSEKRLIKDLREWSNGSKRFNWFVYLRDSIRCVFVTFIDLPLVLSLSTKLFNPFFIKYVTTLSRPIGGINRTFDQ